MTKDNKEPVGEVGTMPGTTGFTMACFKAESVPVGTKLYTSTPAAQRQWVWLTDEELSELIDDANDCDLSDRGFIKAIEAKLREKNT
jgi:hypothetical protein